MTQPAIAYTVRDTSLGPLLVAATPRGVCLVRFGEKESELVAELEAELPYAALARDDEGLAGWAGALVDRVDGRPAPPAPPLDVSGSRFQRRVWEALRDVPAGTTRTYGEIAESVGHPRAARAVGTACARNPVAVAVPCHRALPAAGGLGGYRYGTWRKAALLDRESMPQQGPGARPSSAAPLRARPRDAALRQRAASGGLPRRGTRQRVPCEASTRPRGRGGAPRPLDPSPAEEGPRGPRDGGPAG